MGTNKSQPVEEISGSLLRPIINSELSIYPKLGTTLKEETLNTEDDLED
jgi:hypothetical protein